MHWHFVLRNVLLMLFLARATYTDIRSRKIENRLILFMALTGVLVTLCKMDLSYIISAFAGVLVAAIVFLVTYFFSKGNLGEGDVKLAICMGLYTGIYDFINIMIYALILTVIVGVCVVIAKRENMKTKLPFAPYILAGSIINFVFYMMY